MAIDLVYVTDNAPNVMFLSDPADSKRSWTKTSCRHRGELTLRHFVYNVCVYIYIISKVGNFLGIHNHS